MRNEKDGHKTTEWAIAKVKGASAVAVGMHFKLANRVTGRAHDLYFFGGGVTFGIQGKVPFTSGRLSYKSFRTRKAVNFEDFRFAARLTGFALTVGVGYSKSYLTIWPGSAHFQKPLAKIFMGGWSVGRLGIRGQLAVYGILHIKYGDGEPHGLFRRTFEYKEPHEAMDRLARVRSTPNESPLMALPGDVMFGFDKHTINPAADKLLRKAATIIELRDQGRVEIAGHTDSIGSPSYNKELSRKRAEAVRQWFVRQRVHNATRFQVKGYGEERPIAPNKRPDGSDNPQGRKENRRVAIIFHYAS